MTQASLVGGKEKTRNIFLEMNYQNYVYPSCLKKYKNIYRKGQEIINDWKGDGNVYKIIKFLTTGSYADFYTDWVTYFGVFYGSI